MAALLIEADALVELVSLILNRLDPDVPWDLNALPEAVLSTITSVILGEENVEVSQEETMGHLLAAINQQASAFGFDLEYAETVAYSPETRTLTIIYETSEPSANEFQLPNWADVFLRRLSFANPGYGLQERQGLGVAGPRFCEPSHRYPGDAHQHLPLLTSGYNQRSKLLRLR